MAAFLDVWVNCPDRETAEAIAADCIERRLAACANIFAPIASLYHWKGKVESDQEVPLVLKTRAALFDDLCVVVKARHPFEVPSIVATELVAIEKAYAAWLEEETAPR
ncbi:divalent cation tolerance protein CutA [Chelativorans sp. ZYF759]|uniref:divalent-cation tolerance protein CutA n=1 Tax=Chelativorans sp. ZYF759 TaxID=2692213 RepID=UPI00145E832F|nr:divalent-cation tolerance protein CutA [Chelativorans sp. ZYF759]NMG40949.1 divalent cation tolerance protein CutA [Chelativorans sp. ZYF759]